MKNSKFALTLIAGAISVALCAPVSFAAPIIEGVIHKREATANTDTTTDSSYSSNNTHKKAAIVKKHHSE